ncbi:DNA-directed RNA polymerase subunit H [Candidatus Woesearchaeota archaeon]|nr:DNA-directed RNA polymerase subunit H [Candidatus Woesearchaeota archaeon]
MATKLKVGEHILVPKHIKLSDKEKAELLTRYSITENDLPRISIKDAALGALNLKPGDVVRIERTSITAGSSTFYRRVT